MLDILRIKNFALAEDVEINFKNGFNVIIGETGAGKSIILKSLMFALGDKFNKSFIRTGETFVKVTAVFSCLNNQTINILENMGIEKSEPLIITRYSNLSGKNEIRVNGDIISLGMLKKLSETLLSFCGQHDSLSLLKPNKHIEILDSLSISSLYSLKNEITKLYNEHTSIKDQLRELGEDNEGRARKIDLLNYQICEIEDINPQINEDINLENKIYELRNYAKISAAVQETLNQITISSEHLKNSIKSLNNASKFNDNFQKYDDKLNNSFYDINDIKDSLVDYLQNNSFSEYELEETDKRLESIKNLKRKYGSTIENIYKFLEDTKQEKELLENADSKISSLNATLFALNEKLQEKSTELTSKRQALAKSLEEKLSKELKELGMQNAMFKVEFKKLENFTSNGVDAVEFLFSANTGESLKALSSTISGGEMSRFMLALKNIINENDDIGTIIFDEIDAGISGEIGSAIAEKIAKISNNNQVICITHLQQVCAMADHYYFVHKEVKNNKTNSNVKELEYNEIVKAISRLAGGEYNSEIALNHAQNLKFWAENYKKTIKK